MSDHRVIAETYGLNVNQQKIENLEKKNKRIRRQFIRDERCKKF